MTIDELKEIVLPVCEEFEVYRLDVFGSIAKGLSGTDSDADFLVELKSPDRFFAKRFFGLLHKLEDALECRVDLLTLDSLKNPYFKRQVLKERVPLYEG